MTLAWPAEGEPAVYAELVGSYFYFAGLGASVGGELDAIKACRAWGATREGDPPSGWRVVDIATVGPASQ